MQLTGILQMRSQERIREFLSAEHVGRISTIDSDGFPQTIPMNFVYLDGAVYMHSHVRGEKLDNVTRNGKAGFEVDRELEFLPSYFEDPLDASLADTLYVSVVIKGVASIVTDRKEKTLALNGLMEKYQPEGRYEPIRPDMKVLDAVSVIRISPRTLRGKYKIGQQLRPTARLALAQKILKRGSPTAFDTLEIMGFEVVDGEPVMTSEPKW